MNDRISSAISIEVNSTEKWFDDLKVTTFWQKEHLDWVFYFTLSYRNTTTSKVEYYGEIGTVNEAFRLLNDDERRESILMHNCNDYIANSQLKTFPVA